MTHFQRVAGNLHTGNEQKSALIRNPLGLTHREVQVREYATLICRFSCDAGIYSLGALRHIAFQEGNHLSLPLAVFHMVCDGYHVQSVCPCLLYTIFGCHVSIGINGVDVQVALQHHILVYVGQNELVAQNIVAHRMAHHVLVVLVLVIDGLCRSRETGRKGKGKKKKFFHRIIIS